MEEKKNSPKILHIIQHLPHTLHIHIVYDRKTCGKFMQIFIHEEKLCINVYQIFASSLALENIVIY